MEVILLFALLVIFSFYLWSRQTHSLDNNKLNTLSTYKEFAEKLYKYVKNELKEMPQRIQKNIDDFQNSKDSSSEFSKKEINQYRKNLKFYNEMSDDVKRVRDKYLRVSYRFEDPTHIESALKITQDYGEWILSKANLLGYHGFDGMIGAITKDDTKVRLEEIERSFDKLLEQ